MKKLLLIAFVFFTKSAFAQKDTVGLNVPVTTNGVVYEKVFDVSGISKNLLYSNAKVFFIKQHYNKFGNQLQDSVLYRVMGKDNQVVVIQRKGIFTVSPTYNFDFLLQIDCKDNKYRCRIYNIILSDNITPNAGGPAAHIYTCAEDLLASLQDGRGTSYYTKSDIKNIFSAMKIMVNNELLAVQNAMADTDDF